MKHPSQEQLLAFRDGESEDPWVLEHLASCSRCQRVFDDSRWNLALRRLRAAEADQTHPHRHELVAFVDNALSSAQARSIQRHLRSCDRCLALYRRLREIESAFGYSSPRPELLRSVSQKFSPRPPMQLGTVLLKRLGETLALHYLPEPRPAAAGLASLMKTVEAPPLVAEDAEAAEVERSDPGSEAPGPSFLSQQSSVAVDRPGRRRSGRHDAGEPHPSSARARMRRLAEDRDEAEEALASIRKASFDVSREVLSRAGAAGDPGATTTVEAGPLRFELEGSPGDRGFRLALTAYSVDSERPARGVRVLLEPERGSPVETRTDGAGRARLPFPPGVSRLTIGGQSPIELTLQHLA